LEFALYLAEFDWPLGVVRLDFDFHFEDSRSPMSLKVGGNTGKMCSDLSAMVRLMPPFASSG
jgi:hypothetical protein